VAVHKRNVQDYDGDGNLDHHDCFPVPVYLTCKSSRKNEVTACGKAVLAQDVVLTRGGTAMDLVLLAANLDTDDAAKLGQLKELERLLRARLGQRPFCALIWGDLNNRLVAFEELKQHTTEKGGKWVLKDSGVDLLVKQIDDPAGRRELLGKDSLVYTGRDLAGRPFQPPACNVLLRELFSLHVDAVADRGLPVPLPSYKRSPLDVLVSSCLGCAVRFRDVACRADDFRLGLAGLGLGKIEDCRWAYFGWVIRGDSVQRSIAPPGEEEEGDGLLGDDPAGAAEGLASPLLRGGSRQCFGAASSTFCLQLGWPDGVGIYRGGTTSARLAAWETEDRVLAFDHLPIRATVLIDAPAARHGPAAWLRSPAPSSVHSDSEGGGGRVLVL
jgi:hypothetical protein